MGRTIKLFAVSLLAFASISLHAQKKVKTLFVTKVLPLSAEEVWKVVGEDYGRIANSHPKIVSSGYINGSLKGEEGAERVCYFNEKETRFLKEKMIDYDPENMTFVNTIFQAGKFPVDPELTRAIYKVQDLGDGTCRLTFDMQYRTSPAFLGGMMKGQFKKIITDYFIAIEHHAKTGEKVTKDNFKDIKKSYAFGTSSESNWDSMLKALAVVD